MFKANHKTQKRLCMLHSGFFSKNQVLLVIYKKLGIQFNYKSPIREFGVDHRQVPSYMWDYKTKSSRNEKFKH